MIRAFRRQRLLPMTEALAYARCHGERGRDIVSVVRVAPHPRRLAFTASGEIVRLAFEAKLAERGR